MRERLRLALINPFIAGSIVIFSGSFAVNLLNFFFNLFMSRNLSVTDYGVLTSLASLGTVASLLSIWITPTIVQFAASYFAKNDIAMVRGLYLKVIHVSLILSIVTFLVLFVFQEKIGIFFKIDNGFIIFLVNMAIAFNILNTINVSLLQAKLSFRTMTSLNFLGGVIRLFLGIGAIVAGYRLNGVMIAFLLSSIIPYIISFVDLRFLFHRQIKTPHISYTLLLKYSIPAAFCLYSLSSFITMDIILVKHFFDPESAGLYAGLSLVGKVIFFFSAPLSTSMFPIITQKYTKKESFHNIFLLAFSSVFVSSCGITIFYFLFPNFVIALFLKNQQYLVMSSLLGVYGIYISLYSLVYIMINFFLSIKKLIVFVPLSITAILQIIGIWIFHGSFMEVILVSITLMSLLLTYLLLYYWRLYKDTL